MANIGDLIVGGVYPVVSGALGKGLELSTKAGELHAITIHNYNATARMVLLLDQTADPTSYSAQAVTPLWALPITGSGTGGPGYITADWTTVPLAFKNGLWVLLSTVLTTPFSATATGTADGFFSAQIDNA